MPGRLSGRSKTGQLAAPPTLAARGDPVAVSMAILAGAEAFTDIARFGEKKLALLRERVPFA